MIIICFSVYADDDIDINKIIPSENDIYSVEYLGAQNGTTYSIVVVNDVFLADSDATVTADNVVYATQIKAASSSIKTNIYMPNMEDKVYTVVLGDSNKSNLKILGYITKRTIINVEGVAFQYKNETIAIGAQKRLQASITPSNASDQSVEWSSSDENVVTVDSQGIITGIADGKANITVKTKDGNFSDTCAVTVNQSGIDENAPIIEIGEVSGVKDDRVKVDITLKNNPGLTDLKLSVNYDGSKLYLDTTEKTSLFDSYITDTNDKIPYTITFSSEATMDTSGVIASMYFYVDGGKENEQYPITASVTDAKNNSNAVNISVKNGLFTYKEGDNPEPIPNNCTIEVGSASGRVGDTVEIPIQIKNNPGIEAVQLELTYSSNLTLVKYLRGDGLPNLTRNMPSGAYSVYPYVMMFMGDENDYSDGTLATLTFKINDNTPKGEYQVNVNYKEKNIYNHNYEYINPTVTQGKIKVSSYTPGDINGDSFINGKDVTWIMKKIVGGYDTSVVIEDALDVDGDGECTIRDATHLRRYLVGGFGNIILH